MTADNTQERVVKPPTEISIVQNWFARIPLQCVCYDCIISETGVRRAAVVAMVNRYMAQKLASRYRAKCSLCGQVKQVAILDKPLR